MTGQNLAEVPNMSQRTVMQCLSMDDWKVVAHLPVPVGELMVAAYLIMVGSRAGVKSKAKQSGLRLRGSRRSGPARIEARRQLKAKK